MAYEALDIRYGNNFNAEPVWDLDLSCREVWRGEGKNAI